MTKDVLVFVEQRDGVFLPAALQCLTAAAELAGRTGGRVAAALIGSGLAPLADDVAQAGVAAVYLCDAEALAKYNALTYSRALADIIVKSDPQVVLMAASFMGRDLSPRVAIRLDAGLATDCTALKIGEHGALVASRPVFNGKATNQVHFNPKKLQIASVRPNMFTAPPPADGAGAERIDVPFVADAGDARQITRWRAMSCHGRQI
ncbi:MAG: electron transfer flavoprotein subunit alpha/FixB family protein, partial [Phycisphaerae bacterium]